MKRKFVSRTYLRDVSMYQIKLYYDEDDYYISVKKLIKVDEKFIINDGLCVMDDNYYVFEVVPKVGNYAMRLFLDDKRNPLEYYFDIFKSSGIDKDTGVFYYDDLYLDVTCCMGKTNILDMDELDEALKEKDITEDDYNFAIKTKDKILDEIKNNTNELMNIDYNKYLF